MVLDKLAKASLPLGMKSEGWDRFLPNCGISPPSPQLKAPVKSTVLLIRLVLLVQRYAQEPRGKQSTEVGLSCSSVYQNKARIKLPAFIHRAGGSGCWKEGGR
ncbi:hypothetical protein DPEC_G00254290 [Dallia pectoralis]|uniref:Uncharacterized protein n=1 Tax=Dallia pectoralis TaxID=75939 RepID=A0ACC2FU65_DALPE|nr:hypothetical protein DPEC_G00254290 [Dallia pectoralis]